LAVTTNADAEVTESGVPGESLSPSNVQLPPMDVASPIGYYSTLKYEALLVCYWGGIDFSPFGYYEVRVFWYIYFMYY
jgi:hypothetical protein